MSLLPEGLDPFRGFVLLIIGAVFYIGPALVQAESIGAEQGWHPAALGITVIGVTISLAGVFWYWIGRPTYLKYQSA